MLLSLVPGTSVPAFLESLLRASCHAWEGCPKLRKLAQSAGTFPAPRLWAGLQAGPHSPLIMCDPHNSFSTRKFHVAESL